MISELLEVGSKLTEFNDRLQQSGEIRRKRIATYFLNINKCLSDSVQQLKSGQTPNAKWGELKVYARKLPMTIGREIGDEMAEELSFLLLSTARNIPTDQDISSIEDAAGTFQGLANTVYAKQSLQNYKRRKVLKNVAIGASGLFGGVALSRLIPNERNVSKVTDENVDGMDRSFPYISWNMPTFLGDSVSDTILYSAPYDLCDRIRKMTGDQFDIKVTTPGDTAGILDKVDRKEVPCGYSGIYYGSERYSLFFNCAIPFGLTQQEQNAWLDYKDPDSNSDIKYAQSIYQKLDLDVIAFPIAGTGAQAGGWFNKKMMSVSDFNNIKMRAIGIGGEVLKKTFGIITLDDLARAKKESNIPIDTAVQMLSRGELDAVEWAGPFDDIQLKLHEAARFYHYPGWWEPGTTFDVQVNRESWEGLPPTYRRIFESACHETHLSILNEYNIKNSEAFEELQKLEQEGTIELVRFSDEILATAKQGTEEFLALYDNPNNAIFQEIYGIWRAFKERSRAWSDRLSL